MSIPVTMRVAGFAVPGGPDVLRIEDRPVPPVGPGEVLVRVAAAGVNRADVSLRSGRTRPPPGLSDLPGLEIAGEIVWVGAEVTEWRRGDRCMALTGFGGYAEFCAIPAVRCAPIPLGMTLTAAAAVMETFVTVWSNVFEIAHLQPGEWLLVHGGGSGIGTTAIQLARALGSRVIVTAGDEARCAACRDLGADLAVNYRTEDFAAAARTATGGRGVDVLLDVVGGTYLDRNIAALGMDGRLVMIALLEGAAAQINLLPLLERRITVTGSTLKARTPAEKGRIARSMLSVVLPLLEAGTVRPIIDGTFPLERAADAHRRIESDHFGKIILTMEGADDVGLPPPRR